MRLWKILLVLIVLAVAALAGYAYFGDMQPEQSEIRLPVELDLNSGQPAQAPVAAAPDTGAADAADAPAQSE